MVQFGMPDGTDGWTDMRAVQFSTVTDVTRSSADGTHGRDAVIQTAGISRL